MKGRLAGILPFAPQGEEDVWTDSFKQFFSPGIHASVSNMNDNLLRATANPEKLPQLMDLPHSALLPSFQFVAAWRLLETSMMQNN